MKRYKRYPGDELVSRKDNPNEVVMLEKAMMNGVENLDIFDDDDASPEDCAQAVVDYVEEFYSVDDILLSWVYEFIRDTLTDKREINASRSYAKFVEGLGWAIVDEAGDIWELVDEPADETDDDYDAQARDAEWEFYHGYRFDDDDRH